MNQNDELAVFCTFFPSRTCISCMNCADFTLKYVFLIDCYSVSHVRKIFPIYYSVIFYSIEALSPHSTHCLDSPLPSSECTGTGAVLLAYPSTGVYVDWR